MNTLARYLDPEVIRQVTRLDLRARFIVEGFLAGLHRSPFQGLSTEFSEHRKYVQGDDVRSLDWNVFARTDRLYVRKYQAETHLDCHLIVDASASMGYVGEAASAPQHRTTGGKLDYAIHLAAALGYLVTHQQDAVGLAVIDQGLRTLLPARSRRSDLVQLLSHLTTVRPRGTTGLADGMHRVLAQVPHRGLLVVLSDLLTDADEMLEAFHHARYRGHDLIVMHILDAAEVQFPFEGAVRLADPEGSPWLESDAAGVREAYVQAVAEWRAGMRETLSALRADYVALDTSMKFDRALVEFLVQRSHRR